MKNLVFILFTAMLFSMNATAHECNPQKPKDPCAKPAPKKPLARRTTSTQAQKAVNENDNENENEQAQKQNQTVNVYNQVPAQQSERRVIIEKSVFHHKYNNRVGFLLGVGPRDCCILNNNNRVLVGGAYYERRIAGPFNLGVGALTNRTYFGMLGIDF